MKKLKDGTIRYRINEFSNMTGIPPAVIRYYESQGYPFPRREANGYRTFQVEDAYRLNMFRSIHARGFSVGESIVLMQDTPRQELQDRLAENLNAMDLEIERLRQRRNWTEESLRLLELRAREPDAVWEEQLEETLYHPASIQDDYTIAQDNAAVRIAWDERVGMTRYVGICSGGDFAEGRPAGIDAGAAATITNAERFSLPVDETVRRLPMGRCVCFFTDSRDREYLRLERHPAVRGHLAQHHLQAAGDILLYYLMLYIAEKEDGEDLAVACLPVREA